MALIMRFCFAMALLAWFGAKSYPLYILIGADGNIAGEQNGAAGEDALRHLLRKAGVE